MSPFPVPHTPAPSAVEAARLPMTPSSQHHHHHLLLHHQPSSVTGGGDNVGLLNKMLGKSMSKSPSADRLLSVPGGPVAAGGVASTAGMSAAIAAAAGGGDCRMSSAAARQAAAARQHVPMSLLVRPKLLWKVRVFNGCCSAV